MTQDIAIKPEPTNAVPMPQSDNPIMAMAMQASARGDVDTLKQLLAIRDSEEARDAERLFNSAYAKMQRELPVIPKRGTGHNGIRYARIEDIMQGVMPVLARHGMSLRHKTDNADGDITVTAILAHDAGHSETDVFVAKADTSGSKNSIQAIKSTITYARRTTAENILGLASHGEDDNAFKSEDTPVMSTWRDAIGAAKTEQDLSKLRADLFSDTDVTEAERTALGKVWAARNAYIVGQSNA